MTHDINRKRSEFLRDIDARQRNIVFPDTASNEGRFWRNVVSGKQKLTGVQVAGIAIVFLALAGAFYGYASLQMSMSGIQGSLWTRILGTFGGLVIPLGVFAAFLAAIKLSVYRNDRRNKSKFTRH